MVTWTIRQTDTTRVGDSQYGRTDMRYGIATGMVGYGTIVRRGRYVGLLWLMFYCWPTKYASSMKKCVCIEACMHAIAYF